VILSKVRKKSILRHFVLDGVGASICEGFTESQFLVFASSIVPSNSWFGFMASMQNLISFFLQLCSATLTHYFKTQKRFVLFCVGLQILVLAGLNFSVLFQWGFVSFLFLSISFTVLGSMSAPAWSHWVSELIPSDKKGAFFGIRNSFSAPSQLFAVLLAGSVLHWGGQHELVGSFVVSPFVLVFSLGFVAKIFSFWHLLKQPEIRLSSQSVSLSPENPIQFFKFSMRCIDTQRIAVILAATGFAIHLSLPYQTVYLLHHLHLGYDEVGFITATYLGVRFIISRPIGAIIDGSGSRWTLIISSLLLPLAPLGWAISHSFSGIWLTQIIASTVWSVFELSVFSFISDAMPHQRRQRAFTVRYMSWSLASVGGAVLGGIIVSQVRNPVSLFYLSFFARVIAACLVMEVLGVIQLSGYFRFGENLKGSLEEEGVEE